MSHLKRGSLALGLLLLLLTPAHAHATPPTREVFSLNASFTAAPGDDLNPCSQPLSVVQTGNLYVTSYYDQSGNLVRQLEASPQLTLTITGPNGNSLTALSPAPVHAYFASNTVTLVFTGQQIRFTIPGSGSVIAGAGRATIVIDLTTDQVISNTFTGELVTNSTAFCSYLGAS